MSDLLNQFQKFAYQSKAFEGRKKAIIYTRVSTKEQAETNSSLETQKKYCEQYALKTGLQIVGYFGGTHESAKSDDRKEFKRMIKHAKQNKSVGYIIVYSYDRFSRTGSSASQISNELSEYGIQVKAATQEVDTLTPSGKFQQDLFYIFSHFDNQLRRDKTITAMKDLLRKGYWLWSPPKGYTNLNSHQKAVDWKIEINKEGKLLKKAFKWKIKNGYSNATIVKKLNKLGMNINDKRISEIFKNPFYCGVLISKIIPGEAIEGIHPKIVSKEDFIKINNIQTNHPKTHTDGNINLPLKQFIFCSNCNTPLTGFVVKKKGLYYYKCRSKGCSCTKSAKKLHASFSEKLEQLQIGQELQEVMREVMVYVYDEITHEIRTKSAQNQKKVSEINSKFEKLEERFALGEINDNIFNKYSKKYQSEVEKIKEENQFSELKSSNLQKSINLALKMSVNLTDLWSSGDLETKQQLQKLIFPSGIGYNKQLDEVQTKEVNHFISVTNCLSKNITKIKSGDSINKDRISALVTPAGFKPATLRAEI